MAWQAAKRHKVLCAVWFPGGVKERVQYLFAQRAEKKLQMAPLLRGAEGRRFGEM